MIAYVGKEVYSGKPRGSPEKAKRNASIMRMRHRGKSYQQIADRFGIDKSRVAQIVKRLQVRWTAELTMHNKLLCIEV